MIRDVDENASAAAATVKAILREYGQPEPAHGTVIRGPDARVGMFLIPDGSTNGALEDLCLRGASEAKNLAFTMELLSKVENEIYDGQALDARSKRAATIYLNSCRGKRCNGVGRGAHLKYFVLSDAVFDELRRFVMLMLEV